MAYLKLIVNHINTVLETSLLQDNCFSDRKVVGLAQGLPRYDREGAMQIMPSYVDNDGEGQYVGPDDDYALMLYHRVTGVIVGKSGMPAFGNSKRVESNTARVSLVAFGRRDRLRLTNDELAILLQAAIPESVPKAMLTELQFQSGNIIINDIILNDLQVFQEEFQGIEYFLKPDQFLLKVNYTIESAFLKKCFTNCSPCSS